MTESEIIDKAIQDFHSPIEKAIRVLKENNVLEFTWSAQTELDNGNFEMEEYKIVFDLKK